MLLKDRQELMRQLAAGLTDGTASRTEVSRDIQTLLKHEVASAKNTKATIERSDHVHVKKSGQAALLNRKTTIKVLKQASEALHNMQDLSYAAELLTQAANQGGKKSEKAARKAPTVALYVQYLAEVDPDFQSWLAARGVQK